MTRQLNLLLLTLGCLLLVSAWQEVEGQFIAERYHLLNRPIMKEEKLTAKEWNDQLTEVNVVDQIIVNYQYRFSDTLLPPLSLDILIYTHYMIDG
jgi:hypothetical protein